MHTKSSVKQTEQASESSLTLDDRIAIGQMRLFCKQKKILLSVSVVVIFMICFLWGAAPLEYLLFILVYSAIVIMMRLRYARQFLKLQYIEININDWKKRFVKIALLNSSIYVVILIIGYMFVKPENQGVLDLVTVGVCGAALGSMTLIPGIFSYFSFPPILVIGVYHLFKGDFYCAAGTVIMIAAYLTVSQYIDKTITQSFRLVILNEGLTETAERQQQNMAAILNNLPDATFVVDSEGVVTAWNRVAELKTGVKAADIIGKGNYEYALAFYGERRPVLVDLLFETESELRQKYDHFTKVGDYLTGEGFVAERKLWFEATASPLRDPQGNVVGGIETVRDITARKNIQLEMEASKNRLNNIINMLPDAAFVADSDGVITAWNRAAEQMTGARADDMIGKGNREYAIPFYGERCPILIDMILSPDQDASDRYGQVRLMGNVIAGEACIRPKGKELWIQAYATELRDAHGNFSGAIETVRDITEHKQLEEGLLSSERQLAQIIDMLPDTTFVIDRNGVVTAWNRAAEQMLGVKSSEIIGKGNYEYAMAFYGERRPILIDLVFLPEDELLNETYSHLRRVDDMIFAENYVTLPGGRKVWIVASATLLRDADGNISGAIETVRDLSERKRFEDDLAAARETAERASQSKADFLANMSHEIRTPMNAIIGMSYLALQTELSPKQRNYIQKTHRAAENLLGIINEILDFSKIEAGKMSIEKADFQLEDVLDNLANLLGLRAADKNLELLFKIAPDIPTALVGDSLRLGQVLINLGNNALKFTELGEIVIGIEAILLTPQEVELHFWVTDSGIGMTQEQQQRLFHSFSQADTSTTRKYGGTGLGLVISKNFVELMGGRMWVESEYGKGSTFHFNARLGLQTEPRPQRVSRTYELEGLRMLVADDSAIAREILVTMSSAFGMAVDEAVDGSKALKMIELADKQGVPYELVLMDWKMPTIDGIECLRQIREAGLAREPKIIIVTGYGKDDMLNSAGTRGVQVQTVLTKPVTASTLLEAIGETMGKALIDSVRMEERVLQQSNTMHKLRGARLLLVEDNEMNQEIALDLLGSAGIEIVLAFNGQHALDVLAGDARFDGILMDCQMPVMDGYTATREIRKNPDWASLPIIAMTANVISGEREKVLAVGMCDHISKPINVIEMFDTLARWIEPANPADSDTNVEPTEKVSFNAPRNLPVIESHAGIMQSEAQPSLPLIPGLDTVAGMSHCRNKLALYLKLLSMFVDGHGDSPTILAEHLDNEDWENAERLAHSIKGLTGTLGSNGLQALSGALERACNARQKVAANDALQLLTPELTAFTASLQRYLEQQNTTTKHEVSSIVGRLPVDVRNRPDCLPQLRRFLIEGDNDAIELWESRRLDFAGFLSPEVIKRIDTALQNFEFNSAEELLAGLFET
ncbi:MAG: PAS domain S-box protein [Desulfuromonadaceae bacterium]|nr:PAS domain S-box protein [Desulfuromonadaceae bacterium]